jgi:hypothetical protein
MNQKFISVPFKTESGVSTVNGVAKFSGAGIVLEFESKLFGIISGGVKEVRLAVAEILDVKFKKGFMKRGARIEIRTRDFSTIAKLPNKDGKLTLKLERGDFERGAEAAERICKELSEYQEALPPPHTPIGQLFEDERKEEETRRLNE